MTERDYIEVKLSILQIITAEQAWHYKIIPKSEDENKIEFFADNYFHEDDSIQFELEVLFGKKVVLERLHSDIIKKTLSKYYYKGKKNIKQSNAILEFKDGERDFLMDILSEAIEIKASDIHFEPFENSARVRFRIDGKLVERYQIDKNTYPSFVNKIKIKAMMDIAEKRLPQDGRIQIHNLTKELDIRVSILPTLHGEKVVLRLLNKDNSSLHISQLGFSEEQLKNYMESVKKTKGIVLISGPTGSGKTTTLYATLAELNQKDTNILTIEDPIEYTIEGINQVQLKENIGLTYASALRTFLRQDPDIIMLGEIRDGETAQMAIRAALTGHLVLSTIHTNSAWSTITRLMDMNIPPFLLADTINVSVAQRLIRLLCNNCKTKTEFNKSNLTIDFTISQMPEYIFNANGCEECYYTGYKNRMAIYEVIPIDNELQENIRNKKMENPTYSSNNKIISMREAAFKLFAEGKTSLEEIYPIMLSS